MKDKTRHNITLPKDMPDSIKKLTDSSLSEGIEAMHDYIKTIGVKKLTKTVKAKK